MSVNILFSDRCQTVIVGAAVGYSRDLLEPFIYSFLARTSCDLCLLVENNACEVKEWLSGFKRVCVLSVPFSGDPRAFSILRFFYIRDFLATTAYSFALICDTRDVIFQCDPFGGILCRLGGSSLIVSAERLKISESDLNTKWVSRFCGNHVLRRLNASPVLCVGVFGGGIHAIRDCLDLMCVQIRVLIGSGPIHDAWGIDQALFNQIVYEKTSCVEIIDSFPQSGVFFNMGDEEVVGVDDDGFVLNEAGLRPNVLHQYDRIPGLEMFLRTSLDQA